MAANREKLFGYKHMVTTHSPLQKGDHPQLYGAKVLDANGEQSYQSFIGSLQWDIATVVMIISLTILQDTIRSKK